MNKDLFGQSWCVCEMNLFCTRMWNGECTPAKCNRDTPQPGVLCGNEHPMLSVSHFTIAENLDFYVNLLNFYVKIQFLKRDNMEINSLASLRPLFQICRNRGHKLACGASRHIGPFAGHHHTLLPSKFFVVCFFWLTELFRFFVSFFMQWEQLKDIIESSQWNSS